MLSLPTLLIRFDIEKAGGFYGMACYEKLFWALEGDELNGIVLLDGDSAATLAGRENVNVIALQCGDYDRLAAIRDKLAADRDFMEYAADNAFSLLQTGSDEPLVLAGTYADGEFGGGGWPAAAFKDVKARRAKAAEAQPPEAAPDDKTFPQAQSAPDMVAEEAGARPEQRTEADNAAGAATVSPQGAKPEAKSASQNSPFATQGAKEQTAPIAAQGRNESAAPPAAAAPKAKPPIDPARAAKNKRTALLALAAALALGWCALLCAWLPGLFKLSPVKYSAAQLAAALPEAVAEACRRTGDSNAYIEALAELAAYPDPQELEVMIGERPEEDKGKPYTFTLAVDVPVVLDIDSSAFDSGAPSGEAIAEFKKQLAAAELYGYEVDCLVDYDGIYFQPSQMKEIVTAGNSLISEALGFELGSNDGASGGEGA